MAKFIMIKGNVKFLGFEKISISIPLVIDFEDDL